MLNHDVVVFCVYGVHWNLLKSPTFAFHLSDRAASDGFLQQKATANVAGDTTSSGSRLIIESPVECTSKNQTRPKLSSTVQYSHLTWHKCSMSWFICCVGGQKETDLAQDISDPDTQTHLLDIPRQHWVTQQACSTHTCLDHSTLKQSRSNRKAFCSAEEDSSFCPSSTGMTDGSAIWFLLVTLVRQCLWVTSEMSTDLFFFSLSLLLWRHLSQKILWYICLHPRICFFFFFKSFSWKDRYRNM